MDRRHALLLLGTGSFGYFVPNNIFARDSVQNSQEYTIGLARAVAKNLCDKKRIGGQKINRLRHVKGFEYLDKETGEDLSLKLRKWSGPYYYIDNNTLPSNVIVHPFTRAVLEIIEDGFYTFAHAKVYHDKNDSRNFDDPRNSLEVRCYESERTAKEMIELSPEVLASLGNTFGISFIDRRIKGVADIVKGNGANQQTYSHCLRSIDKAFVND